jgi:hypothetical protein
MSSKQLQSTRQQKRRALASLKSARSGHRSGGVGGGQLDALDDLLDDTKNNDVYETMDEEQYREYVERKREREDFVVDDGKRVVVVVVVVVVATTIIYSCIRMLFCRCCVMDYIGSNGLENSHLKKSLTHSPVLARS